MKGVRILDLIKSSYVSTVFPFFFYIRLIYLVKFPSYFFQVDLHNPDILLLDSQLVFPLSLKSVLFFHSPLLLASPCLWGLESVCLRIQGPPVIAVIAVESAVKINILLFKKACEQGERVNTKQNWWFISFVCKTTDNYHSHFLVFDKFSKWPISFSCTLCCHVGHHHYSGQEVNEVHFFDYHSKEYTHVTLHADFEFFCLLYLYANSNSPIWHYTKSV